SVTTPEISPREIAHFNAVREIAPECMVLLKNDGTLPLRCAGNIALFGDGGRNTIRGGSGSGMTIVRRDYSIEDGLEAAGFTVTTKAWMARQARRRAAEQEAIERQLRENSAEGADVLLSLMTGMASASLEPVTTEDIEGSRTDTALFVISRNAGEGDDRSYGPGDFALSDEETAAVEQLSAAYPHVIVILNCCGVIAASFLQECPGVGAILSIGQLGIVGGLPVGDVLLGRATPSGKLADTWGRSYTDYASAPNFGLQEGNMDDVYYEEGIYVGYRYFDSFNVTPVYPFGYGLSYTTFDVAALGVSADCEQVKVRVRVTNTGSECSGKEVVQVYVSAPDGALEKPYQELKAFAKTRELAPGASQVLEIAFRTDSLASYSEALAAWVLEKGDYFIRVGNSSRNTHIAAKLVLDADAVTLRLKNLFRDEEPGGEISARGVAPYSYEGEEREKQAAPVVALSAADFVPAAASYPEARLLEDTHPGHVITAEEVRRGEYTVEELTAQLTVEELAAFVTGSNDSVASFFNGDFADKFRIPGGAAQTTDICLASRGILEVCCSDGPAGLHVDPEFVVYSDGTRASIMDEKTFDHSRDAEIVEHHYMHMTAFPVASTMAQSWNLDLFTEVSRMYGVETKEIGLQIALKPSMNIHRDPLGGRNFEYYSEDPVLSGTCAAADIRGLQQFPGIGSTVKHFAVNSNERNRMHSCAHVHERALREIYLRNFEIAIRTAQPACIMTSYNLLNGPHAANSRDLLTEVCKNEWGYQGMLMTDWFMTESLVDVFSTVDREKPLRYGNTIPHLCVWAGNDIIMPGADTDRADILAAVEDGTLSLADLQKCASEVIRYIFRTDVYEDALPYYDYVTPEAPWISVREEA
ncbi:MAG: glycoside hydrolase family 3 C-terminal domain-containing protein, partial [Oscillospiraceae bacterium]|nr:glycoside hydrolase family 3 C-terminal domain-containing protein [Oscillospiraceae bacterium]